MNDKIVSEFYFTLQSRSRIVTKQIFFHRFGPDLSDFVFLAYAEHRRLYYLMSSGGIFSHFVYVSKALWPEADLRPSPPMHAVSFFLSVYHNSQWLNAIGQKKALSHLLAITRDTYYGDKEKSSGQANVFNIWTIGAIDRTSAQPKIKLSLLHSNSLKFQPPVFLAYSLYQFVTVCCTSACNLVYLKSSQIFTKDLSNTFPTYKIKWVFFIKYLFFSLTALAQKCNRNPRLSFEFCDSPTLQTVSC